jgi:hypothetical protein
MPVFFGNRAYGPEFGPQQGGGNNWTPTSASWINAVEGFFSALTRGRLRRGAFQSVADLEQAIARYIREHNATSSPFVWTKPADSILAKLARLPASSE